jgi:hypothetical protein
MAARRHGTQLRPREAVAAQGFDPLSHYQFCHFAHVDRDYIKIMGDMAG